MAMIKCIECGKSFSDRAPACPNCGCPTSAMTGKKSTASISIAAMPTFGPSSEEAARKMKEAVSAAKSAASSADREFDRANSRIQMKATRSIDLFGGTAVTQVADIAMEAKKACDELYAALQMALMTLDATCRPLLAANPDGTAIQEVYNEIKKLNSDSEISNTFTASLNYDNLGDMATRRYSPSVQAKMIESFWRSEYDKVKRDIDRIAAERREKEEAVRKAAEEKKRRERERFQAANREIIDEYVEKGKESVSFLSELEKEAFAKKKTEITKKREDEKAKVQSSICGEAEKKIANIEKEQSVVDQEYIRTITALRKELEEKKEILPTLGFFKGAAKKTLHSEIEILVTKLQATTEQYRKEADKFEKQINDCTSEKDKSLKKEIEAIESRYPLPEMVQKKQNAVAKANPVNQLTPQQIVNNSLQDAIYEYLLENGGLLTIQEIIEGCPEVCDLTHTRVSAIVRGMIGTRVERVEEKRKAYFRAIEGYSPSSKKKSSPSPKQHPMDVVESFVKGKSVSFSKLKVDLEDYQKYGSLKFLAMDGILYCEKEEKEMMIHYIPEEYRKMN